MLDKHACECVSHVMHLPSCAADMPMETTSASKAVKVDSNPEIIGPDVEDDSKVLQPEGHCSATERTQLMLTMQVNDISTSCILLQQ